MYQFNVPDMTCGHCVSTITKALRAHDSDAKVEIFLREHLVKIDSDLPSEEIAHCIAETGYTPTAT